MNNEKRETVTLGQLYTGLPIRDAVHVAVMTVMSVEKLYPGDHVGLVGVNTAGKNSKHIGIVDPFLIDPVLPGQQFYLCLYPGSITSLRHAWTHPDLKS